MSHLQITSIVNLTLQFKTTNGNNVFCCHQVKLFTVALFDIQLCLRTYGGITDFSCSYKLDVFFFFFLSALCSITLFISNFYFAGMKSSLNERRIAAAIFQ